MTHQQAAAWYFSATSELGAILAGMFQAAYPDYYKRYRAAFEAGVWCQCDGGPFLGRALVYKLQVALHQDGLDAGPTASFPMGFYEGGELYVPDIEAKFL